MVDEQTERARWTERVDLMRQARAQRVDALRKIEAALGEHYLTSRSPSTPTLDVFKYEADPVREEDPYIEALSGYDGEFEPHPAQVQKLYELNQTWFEKNAQYATIVENVVAVIGALRSTPIKEYPRQPSSRTDGGYVLRYLIKQDGSNDFLEQQLDDLSTLLWVALHGSGFPNSPAPIDLANWDPTHAALQLRLRILLDQFDEALTPEERDNFGLDIKQNGRDDLIPGMCLTALMYPNPPEMPGKGKLEAPVPPGEELRGRPHDGE
ncbi:hypothetical protein OC834_004995 [Tilletia horrida]|nr:hypothetical protein OC834_004995 [Tilletia horrida]